MGFNIDNSIKKVLHASSRKSNYPQQKRFGRAQSPIFSFGGVVRSFGLKNFGGKNDLDFDGVPNDFDCQPRNTMRQEAVEFLLPTDRTKTVEKKSFATITSRMEPTGNPEATNFKGMFRPTDKPVVRTYEKPLHPSGYFKDLFKEGEHLEIRNRRGEVVRELIKRGDDVTIKIPGSPTDDIKLSAQDEILYEPWAMDAGSYVFQTQNAPPGLKGKLLKIATEGDDVSPVSRNLLHDDNDREGEK